MLDEPKGTAQDTSSGNAGQSSGSKSGTTSKDKGKLYTAANISKIQSDAKSEAGRLQKTAEQERDTLKEQLQSTTSRLDSLERERDESRLADARGDPDQLRTYQREQGITKREREVEAKESDYARREGQLKADRAEVDKDKSVVSIAYLAAKHGLETEELESLGISDPETLEKVAAKLAGAKPAKEPELGEGGEEESEFTPDSGEGAGGGAGALTTESIEKGSIAAVEKALEKAS